MKLGKQGRLIALILGISFSAHAFPIKEFSIPFGKTAESQIEGVVSINRETTSSTLKITKEFYGADSHGFSKLPPSKQVTPLNLGYVKLGGSLHAVYNWKYNTYLNENEIRYAYASLVDRLHMIQNGYGTNPIFEVNMLGWQPDRNERGMLEFLETANADHAGNAISFLNGKNKIGLVHITMGNEPFDSEEFHDIHILSADEYIKRYIEFAVALRAAQEKISGNPNDIKLWGPEINTGWTGWQTNHLPDCIIDYSKAEFINCSYGDGTFTDFVPYFLHQLKSFEDDPLRNPHKYKMLDYISIHYYSLFRENFNDPGSIIKDEMGNQDIPAMLESVNVWDSNSYVNMYDRASRRGKIPNIIGTFKKWAKNYYPDVKMGLTEFGIDSMDKIKYHPIVRPLYLADFVARAASAGLDAFINSFLQSGDVTNSWAMIDGPRLTPIYYMYYLFTNYFQGQILSTSDTFEDLVNSYAVKTSKGSNIFIVNKDTKVHTTQLQFQNKNKNSLQEISEIELPEWSLTVLEVPDNHDEKIMIHQYGAKEMGILK